MNSDLKKHELLKILSIQKQNSDTPIGVPYEVILNSMKIDKDYLDFISGELYGSEEIKYFQDYQYKEGLHATTLGVSAYSSEKYNKRHKENVWNNRKNFAQTIIPVLSLIIAIMALGLAFADRQTKYIKTQPDLQKEIIKLEYRIKELEVSTTKTKGNDSLNTK